MMPWVVSRSGVMVASILRDEVNWFVFWLGVFRNRKFLLQPNKKNVEMMESFLKGEKKVQGVSVKKRNRRK